MEEAENCRKYEVESFNMEEDYIETREMGIELPITIDMWSTFGSNVLEKEEFGSLNPQSNSSRVLFNLWSTGRIAIVLPGSEVERAKKRERYDPATAMEALGNQRPEARPINCLVLVER